MVDPAVQDSFGSVLALQSLWVAMDCVRAPFSLIAAARSFFLIVPFFSLLQAPHRDGALSAGSAAREGTSDHALR